jgi:hypothetical protein
VRKEDLSASEKSFYFYQVHSLRFRCARKPHAQDGARGSNQRCNSEKAKIGILNEKIESADQILVIRSHFVMGKLHE